MLWNDPRDLSAVFMRWTRILKMTKEFLTGVIENNFGDKMYFMYDTASKNDDHQRDYR